MKIQLNALSIILTVTLTALFGMILGGVFGYFAAQISPEYFEHFLPWQKEIEPVGFAVILGSSCGVICGGGLGAFAITIQTLVTWIEKSRQNKNFNKT